MKTLALLIFSFFYLTQTASSTANNICQPSSCDIIEGPPVQFPFRLTDRPSDRRCGYQGFDLSCNTRNQTILNLPSTGDFVVTRIDYELQELFINPQFCLPGRILLFSLSGSPFTAPYTRNYTFYNCSSHMKVEYPEVLLSCLSGANYTVFGLAAVDNNGMGIPVICRSISTVGFPAKQWSVPDESLGDDFQLTWDVPDCKACEIKGGTCGIKSGKELEIGCFNLATKSGHLTSKLGMYLGIGIPCLLFAIGVLCFRYKRVIANSRSGNTELSLVVSNQQQPVVFKGLDEATIESYPKTVLDERRQLPKPGDSTCPICLSEYLPKDTLRTIPECGHYFHINCIDEWLKLNVTCPVCRNSP